MAKFRLVNAVVPSHSSSVDSQQASFHGIRLNESKQDSGAETLRAYPLWCTHLALASTVLLLWIGVGLGAVQSLRAPLVACAALAFIPYAALLHPRISPPRHLGVLVAYCCAAAAPFLWSDALLSFDVYRHLFEGRVVLDGGNPYQHAPIDLALAHLRDANWAPINHKDIPTVYPAVLQGLFALLSLGGSILSFKLFAFAVHLVTALILYRERPAGVAAWLLALNPLLIIEGSLSGHHDGLIGLFLLLFALAAGRTKQGQALCYAVLAAAVKVVGLLAIFVLHRRAPKMSGLAFALALICIAPSILLADGVSGTTHFAHRWRGNEGAYSLIEAGVGVAFAVVDVPEGIAVPRRTFLPELFNPVATFDGVYNQRLQRYDLQRFVARAIVVFLVCAFALWLGRRRESTDAVVGVLWFALLLSPQLHPWYWMWLLPVAIVSDRRGALGGSAIVLTIYTTLDSWMLAREGGALHGSFHVILWMLFATDLWREHPTREVAHNEMQRVI